MSETRIKGPSAEDLELMEVAKKRLAERFGGQWALQQEVSTVEVVQPLAPVSQSELRSEQHRIDERLRELGLLASTSVGGHKPYFVR